MLEHSPVVETPLGSIAGVRRGSVDLFRSIPYARPPVGPLRWAPPAPVSAFSHTLHATTPGAIAPQNASRLRAVVGDVEGRQAEDCLTLTVCRPSSGAGGLPVFIWLHGGAWNAGSGDLPLYAGEKLAAEGNMIVVGINYRLGALGFLCHPAISTGNLGLLDQICALSWIRANIASFGGDPGNMTLAGQSAGAWSIAMFLANEQTRQLFHRAILQSAPLGIPPMSPELATGIAENFLSRLGLSPSQPDLWDRLREAPVAGLLTAQQETAIWHAKTEPPSAVANIAFRPVADGVVLPTAAGYGMKLQHAAGQMDSLIGYTRDEMAAFAGASAMLDRTVRAEGDAIFVEPALEWARQGARSSKSVFVYQFAWRPPGSEYGACHCIELPFVFGTGACVIDTHMMRGADLRAAEQVSEKVRSAWGAFARSSRMEGSGFSSWPRFDPTRGVELIIDEVSRAREIKG